MCWTRRRICSRSDSLWLREQLNLAIGLPLRNQKELDEFLRQIYDPASTNFHHFLTPEQFTARFGPTEADYQKVIAFARANNLTVTARHPNRAVLDVEGRWRTLKKLFMLACGPTSIRQRGGHFLRRTRSLRLI